jgi:BirA family biotin operon repressor/biotin-[acetyl-CoA-carboxylase] ligase
LPIHDRIPPQQLPLIAGLAVRQTAVELTGETDVQLKWPNDVLHDGRKLAGLLCERIDKSDLIGIGLNVNVDPADAPRDLRDKITSLLSIGGKLLDPTEVLSLLAKNLHAAFRLRAHQPFSVFVCEFEKHHALVGKTITVLPSGSDPAVVGRCEGIDAEGRLMVRQRGTLHRIVAGNILWNSARSR